MPSRYNADKCTGAPEHACAMYCILIVRDIPLHQPLFIPHIIPTSTDLFTLVLINIDVLDASYGIYLLTIFVFTRSNVAVAVQYAGGESLLLSCT